MKKYMHLCTLGVMSMAVVACEPSQVAEQAVLPKPTGLEGRWHYDSIGFDCYSVKLEHFGRSKAEPMRPGAILTIGATSWEYSGSLHELHAYTRDGLTLTMHRVGTPRMVRSGYISSDDIGRAVTPSRKQDIVLLTPTRLIMRDSTNAVDPNCYPHDCFCVIRYYYSR
jgi:hypothetical protein